jgi:hypothetical protein
MNHILLYEIAFYWPWYLCFAVIAFCLGRWLGGLGLLLSAVAISALIMFIEVHSVFHDMREHPESGRDADMIFWFGVLCRLVVYNLAFLPIGLLGWRLRARHRRAAHETQIG